MMNDEKYPNKAGGYGREELHQRIQILIKESKDPNFTKFLNQIGSSLWCGKMNDEEVIKVLNQNLEKYYDNMNRLENKQSSNNENQLIKPVTPTLKNNMEFAVGAGVLGVTGAIFLLIAFVIFAMNFMPGVIRGICLYLVSIAVILVAELFVRKKQEKFSLGMLGVGFSGLFLTTILNYTYLEAFTDALALIICLLITVIAFAVSYFKKSGILRVISLLGGTICLLPVLPVKYNEKFLVVGAMVVLIQLSGALLPLIKEQKWVITFQLVLETITMIALVMKAFSYDMNPIWISVFLLCMLFILNLIYLHAEFKVVDTIVYVFSYFFHVFYLSSLHIQGLNQYIYELIPLVILTLTFTVLLKKNTVLKWIPYWVFHFRVLVLLVNFAVGGKHKIEIFLITIGIFVIAKLLSKVKELSISDIVISAYTFIYLLCFNFEKNFWMIGLLIILIVSSVFIDKYFQVYYRVLATLSIVIGICRLNNGLIPYEILNTVITGVFVLSIFAYYFLDKWKKAGLKIYNYITLAFLAFDYIVLGFQNNLIVSFIMLSFGITVIVFAFDKKFELPEKNKYIVLGIFLVYMALVLQPDYQMIKSILLGADAIFCVIVGFVLRQKNLRIFGLVVAICTSIKVVTVDSLELLLIQRILSFFIVGVLVLGISYLYFYLEKKLQEDKDCNEENKA